MSVVARRSVVIFACMMVKDEGRPTFTFAGPSRCACINGAFCIGFMASVWYCVLHVVLFLSLPLCRRGRHLSQSRRAKRQQLVYPHPL